MKGNWFTCSGTTWEPQRLKPAMQTGGTPASLSSFTSPWAETVLIEKEERKNVYVNFGPQLHKLDSSYFQTLPVSLDHSCLDRGCYPLPRLCRQTVQLPCSQVSAVPHSESECFAIAQCTQQVTTDFS